MAFDLHNLQMTFNKNQHALYIQTDRDDEGTVTGRYVRLVGVCRTVLVVGEGVMRRLETAIHQVGVVLVRELTVPDLGQQLRIRRCNRLLQVSATALQL